MEETITDYLGYFIVAVIVAALIFFSIQIYRLVNKRTVEPVAEEVKRTPRIDDFTYIERPFPLLLN